MNNLIGKTLGQYQIIGLAGRGGMATVYRAYQTSLNRYVALKVLPEYMAESEEFVARFRQEALAAAALRHPNILVIHDVGKEGSFYYIAMEYLEGQTLAEVIRQRGGLNIHRTVRIFTQIASALDYAHQRGLIHRDIKPANIFIGPDDHVTLMDFGIVKALAAAGMTRSGTTVGTPEYMSPEQIEGRPIDHRSDLYSLGIVLYQILTGYVPFTGETPHAVMFAHVNKMPTPPSRLTVFVSPQMEAVVMRALAKDPAQRFSSAREMAWALSQAAAGGSGVVGEQTLITGRTAAVTPLPRPHKKARVLWPLVIGLGLVAVIALVVSVFAVIGNQEANRQRLAAANLAASVTPVPTSAPSSTPMPSDTVAPLPEKPTGTPSPISTVTPTLEPTATRVQTTATSTSLSSPTSGPTQVPSTTQPGVLFDFESAINWRRGDQPNGTLAQSTQLTHSGRASARLDYSFPGGGNDFVVFLNEVALYGQPNAIGAWVYGDGSGHFLNAWIKDSGGQVWQVPLGRVGSSGWRQMAGYIATGQPWPWAHISGPDNGRVDYPVSFAALVLDDYLDSYAGSGTIYIDDISVWRTETVPTPVGTSPAVSATPKPASTSGPTPTVANEPRGVTLISPINGTFFKSSTITFRWSGGALQPGETFVVEILPLQADKGGCTAEYGRAGINTSPPLTEHEWTTDITAVPRGKARPCAGRIEWRVHVRDANGNTIQSTPRGYFDWNPL